MRPTPPSCIYVPHFRPLPTFPVLPQLPTMPTVPTASTAPQPLPNRPNRRQVGCLYVDSKSMRNELLPVTHATLDKIKLLLLGMAHDTCLQVGCVCRVCGGGGLRGRAWGFRASHVVVCRLVGDVSEPTM